MNNYCIIIIEIQEKVERKKYFQKRGGVYEKKSKGHTGLYRRLL
mgnify:CR=1 FL=1